MKRYLLPLFFIMMVFSTAADAKSRLNAQDSLKPGQSLTNGIYKLILQRDGNLVLYKKTKAIWSTNTKGTAMREAIMQRDGNFVLYRTNNSAAWSTRTNGKKGAFLKLQKNGNLTIFHPPPPVDIWNTNTSGR